MRRRASSLPRTRFGARAEIPNGDMSDEVVHERIDFRI
jgi:hypothetical protein